MKTFVGLLGLLALSTAKPNPFQLDSPVTCSTNVAPDSCTSAICANPPHPVKCFSCPALSSGPYALVVQQVAISQNGVALTTGGSLDLKIPAQIDITVTNNWGKALVQPQADIAVSYCGYTFSTFNCKWHSIPTLGLLNSLDVCSPSSGVVINPDCHFKNNPTATTISMSVDLASSSLSSLLGVIAPFENELFTLQVTVRDNQGGPNASNQVLGCVQAEAFVKRS